MINLHINLCDETNQITDNILKVYLSVFSGNVSYTGPVYFIMCLQFLLKFWAII